MTRVLQFREIYEEAFGKAPRFDDVLFSEFKSCIYCNASDNITAGFFLLPCTLKSSETEVRAYYLYAAATKTENRGKGHMSALLSSLTKSGDKHIFLKPARKSLVDFYARFGFRSIKASPSFGGYTLKPEYTKLSGLCRPEKTNFDLMYFGDIAGDFTVTFSDTME